MSKQFTITESKQRSKGRALKKRAIAVALSPPSSFSLNLQACTVCKLFCRRTTNVDLPLTRTAATRARIQTWEPISGPVVPKLLTCTKSTEGRSPDRMVLYTPTTGASGLVMTPGVTVLPILSSRSSALDKVERRREAESRAALAPMKLAVCRV